VLVFRRHAGEYASATPMVEAATSSSTMSSRVPRAVVPPTSMLRRPPLPDVHEWHHRPSRCPALHRRLPGLRGGTSKYYQDIHPTTPTGAWPTSLDHRALVHRVRAAGAGHHHRPLRGRPTYPTRPAVAYRRASRVTIFHTAPTRSGCCSWGRRAGQYDYRFKHMTTVGEPIEPDVWRWYHTSVGKGEAVIVDTWCRPRPGVPGLHPPGLQG